MLKIQLRIPRADIERYGDVEAFCRHLADWNEIDYIKYIQEHGTMIDKIEVFKEHNNYDQVFVTFWKLPKEKETFFRLKWGNV